MHLMQKVLIVDDSSTETKILETLLMDKYETRCAKDGAQGVELAKEFEPQLILMDVEMPVMNGYEACRTLRDSGCAIPIIFLSALSETGDKLKAYEAGGDDFIGKPYDIKEMVAKISRNLERHDDQLELSENHQQAMQMAQRSMVDLSYLGRIINFTQKIGQCHSYEELVRRTFSLLEEINLHSSILIHSTDLEDQVFFDDGKERPVERSMLMALKGKRRILEFSKNRCAFNWVRATMLIRNMPDNEIENGAMKDYLGYVMNAVEDAINTLMVQSKLRSTILKYKDSNKQMKLAIMKIIEDFEESLEALFARPDVAQSLPVDVEDLVINLAHESTMKADELFSSGFNMESELDGVVDMFRNEEQAEDVEEDDDDAITLF